MESGLIFNQLICEFESRHPRHSLPTTYLCCSNLVPVFRKAQRSLEYCFADTINRSRLSITVSHCPIVTTTLRDPQIESIQCAELHPLSVCRHPMRDFYCFL
jgi:hypothetical protein